MNYGYKKASGGYIVKLRIPDDAKTNEARTLKGGGNEQYASYRCDHAFVEEIYAYFFDGNSAADGSKGRDISAADNIGNASFHGIKTNNKKNFTSINSCFDKDFVYTVGEVVRSNGRYMPSEMLRRRIKEGGGEVRGPITRSLSAALPREPTEDGKFDSKASFEDRHRGEDFLSDVDEVHGSGIHYFKSELAALMYNPYRGLEDLDSILQSTLRMKFCGGVKGGLKALQYGHPSAYKGKKGTKDKTLMLHWPKEEVDKLEYNVYTFFDWDEDGNLIKVKEFKMYTNLDRDDHPNSKVNKGRVENFDVTGIKFYGGEDSGSIKEMAISYNGILIFKKWDRSGTLFVDEVNVDERILSEAKDPATEEAIKKEVQETLSLWPQILSGSAHAPQNHQDADVEDVFATLRRHDIDKRHCDALLATAQKYMGFCEFETVKRRFSDHLKAIHFLGKSAQKHPFEQKVDFGLHLTEFAIACLGAGQCSPVNFSDGLYGGRSLKMEIERLIEEANATWITMSSDDTRLADGCVRSSERMIQYLKSYPSFTNPDSIRIIATFPASKVTELKMGQSHYNSAAARKPWPDCVNYRLKSNASGLSDAIYNKIFGGEK